MGCAADEPVLECEFIPQVILGIMEQIDDLIAEWCPLLFGDVLEMMHKNLLMSRVPGWIFQIIVV